MIESKPQVCFVLTTEFSVKAFLLSHLRALTKTYDVTIITNTKNPDFLIETGVAAKVIPLTIARNISLISDVKSMLTLIKIFRQKRFNCVHSITPKAGFLAMLASRIVHVPTRVHTFTGQVWASKLGLKRVFLKYMDCLIASLTTHNLVDSPSQLQFLVDEKITDLTKSRVLAKGSISGVDLSRFKPNLEAGNIVRAQFGLPKGAFVFLFIGRLTVDKGVLDLVQAFAQLNDQNTHLLFVGPDEQNMELKIKQLQNSANLNIHIVGHTDAPESYMAAADILCLPSYREGFGTVLIEAAAVGIPAIASKIYGVTDAVIDAETGLLHEPHDVDAIMACMASLSDNRALRMRLGEQARERVMKDFDSHLVTEAWVRFYQESLN